MVSDLPKDLAEEVLAKVPVTSLRGIRSARKKGNTFSNNRSFTRKHLAQAATRKKFLPAKTTMMPDRPRDLAKEVLSRYPVTSMRGFRSACKKWNILSKDPSFTRKHISQAKAATKEELPEKTTMMSNLPIDLAEEVLSRLPVTSLRGFRAVCKKWNTLSKDRSFTRKHLAQAKASAAREFILVMVMDFRVYLISVNLHGIHNNVDPSINRQGNLVCLNNSDRVDISKIYHCDGLLLCITKDYSRFVVWNPYSCQTLWVKTTSPRTTKLERYSYALGYEDSQSSRNYKVLRFVNIVEDGIAECEIYELNSNSWRVLDFTFDWKIENYARGVSLKGNTYWFAQKEYPAIIANVRNVGDFLICFDFTTERFGPHLSLPFHSNIGDSVALSSVREEQLAVLYQPWDTLHMEIWVTTKIEPEVVLWSKLFLAVDMQPLTDFQFLYTDASFVIDEEKKVVVVFDKDKDVMNTTRNIAYIIGDDGYYKEVDLGESTDKYHYPVVCSYVPSSAYVPRSAQIKQGGRRKKHIKIII